MMKSRSSEEQSGARALESAAEQAMGSSKAGRRKAFDSYMEECLG